MTHIRMGGGIGPPRARNHRIAKKHPSGSHPYAVIALNTTSLLVGIEASSNHLNGPRGPPRALGAKVLTIKRVVVSKDLEKHHRSLHLFLEVGEKPTQAVKRGLGIKAMSGIHATETRSVILNTAVV